MRLFEDLVRTCEEMLAQEVVQGRSVVVMPEGSPKVLGDGTLPKKAMAVTAMMSVLDLGGPAQKLDGLFEFKGRAGDGRSTGTWSMAAAGGRRAVGRKSAAATAIRVKRIQQDEDKVINKVEMGTQTEEADAALGEFEIGDVRAEYQASVGIDKAKAQHITEVMARCCSRGEVYSSLLRWRRRVKKAGPSETMQKGKKGKKVMADVESGEEDWEARHEATQWESEKLWEEMWEQQRGGEAAWQFYRKRQLRQAQVHFALQ